MPLIVSPLPNLVKLSLTKDPVSEALAKTGDEIEGGVESVTTGTLPVTVNSNT